VTLLKFLPAVAIVALLFGCVTVLFVFRARSMRAIAARWGFRYIGPRTPSFWGFRNFRKLEPPVPLPQACHLVGEIIQAWNVIEGQQNGISVLILTAWSAEARIALLSPARQNRIPSQPTLRQIEWFSQMDGRYFIEFGGFRSCRGQWAYSASTSMWTTWGLAQSKNPVVEISRGCWKSQNSRNLGDRKCLPKRRSSFIAHPDAKLFRALSIERVFQHPRLLTTSTRFSLSGRRHWLVWNLCRPSHQNCPPPTNGVHHLRCVELLRTRRR